METVKIESKVVLITGVSSGIGRETAQLLAERGARVFGTVRDLGRADPIAKVKLVLMDITDDKSVKDAAESVLENAGRIDILINNAGVYEFSPLQEITEEHFHKHFNVNVLGLLLTSQAALKQFGPEGGSIINISSGASTVTPPNTAVYTATKGAVDAVTRTLAKELGPRNIRVNAINPGMVITEGVQAGGFDKSDFRKQLESQTPLGRIGQTEDIAPAAVFLASSDSSWISGETLMIAGGLR